MADLGLMVAVSDLWIGSLIGLQVTRIRSRKRESKQIPFILIGRIHTDPKINHENIGKNRCQDPNTRLGKLMWNYFMKPVKHMEQVTKWGHYSFLLLFFFFFKYSWLQEPGCSIEERKMKEGEKLSYPLK